MKKGRMSGQVRPREPYVNAKAAACGLLPSNNTRYMPSRSHWQQGAAHVQLLNRGDLLLIAVLWLLSRSKV